MQVEARSLELRTSSHVSSIDANDIRDDDAVVVPPAAEWQSFSSRLSEEESEYESGRDKGRVPNSQSDEDSSYVFQEMWHPPSATGSASREENEEEKDNGD